MATGDWLAGWWNEMSHEQRERWLTLDAGGEVPVDLARGLTTYAARERRVAPYVGTQWVGRGVTEWHVAGDVWDFIDTRRA